MQRERNMFHFGENLQWPIWHLPSAFPAPGITETLWMEPSSTLEYDFTERRPLLTPIGQAWRKRNFLKQTCGSVGRTPAWRVVQGRVQLQKRKKILLVGELLQHKKKSHLDGCAPLKSLTDDIVSTGNFICVNTIQKCPRGWRVGSVVTSTCCSRRGPGFCSQPSHHCLQISRGSNAIFWPP